MEITATFPAGVIGTTLENLKAAAMGEHDEWTDLYPGFAKVAREEGFQEVAKLFDSICVAEKQHEKRYHDLRRTSRRGWSSRRTSQSSGAAGNCGYLHEGPEALGACPACAHPQGHFELLGENW